MPYLTPDSPPAGEFFCRVLRVPATPAFLALIDGAITELCKAHNFEQFGTLTPEETAELFLQMWFDAMNDGNVCMPEIGVDVFLHNETQGTAGGGITANTDTRVPYNIPSSQQSGNVSLSGNVFTIQPGTYLMEFEHILRNDVAALSKSWIALEPGTIIAQEGISYNAPTLVQSLHRAVYRHRFVAEVDIAHWIRSNDTRATDAFGVAANISGHGECYGIAKFTRFAD
jgi:hypothetical protein